MVTLIATMNYYYYNPDHHHNNIKDLDVPLLSTT